MISEEKIIAVHEDFTPFVLRFGIFYCVGTYHHKENRVCISNIYARGRMKYFMDYLIKKFNTRKILFFCVMNFNAFSRLRGFNRIIILYHGDAVECLEGEWE